MWKILDVWYIWVLSKPIWDWLYQLGLFLYKLPVFVKIIDVIIMLYRSICVFFDSKHSRFRKFLQQNVLFEFQTDEDIGEDEVKLNYNNTKQIKALYENWDNKRMEDWNICFYEPISSKDVRLLYNGRSLYDILKQNYVKNDKYRHLNKFVKKEFDR